MQLHERIGLMRKVKCLSQEGMAERLGMSINGYGKIERGETDLTFSRLEQISKILEINLIDSLGMEDRGIFNIASSQTNFNNHINTTATDAKVVTHQLKLEIMYLKESFTQKDKEIALLRELLEMLKNQQGLKTVV